MGRKRMAETKEHKAIYMTEKESKQIDKKAAKAVMSSSSFMRKTLIETLGIETDLPLKK